MQLRHKKRDLYFEEQAYTTLKYVIPFIEEFITLDKDIDVLEIGCGEGGNLLPFLEKGCRATGIDLASNKIQNARQFFRDHELSDKVTFIHKDIYQVNNGCEYDLIVMRDVLEHIHNQEKFMGYVKKFLKKNGLIFLGFPPWQNPFGGHQQICRNKFLSKLPYFHILPKKLYTKVLQLFGEETTLATLLEIKETNITIERFRRIVREKGYSIEKEVFYFINPNYEIKFKLKPRRQLSFINKIPYLRNYFTTTCYYLIRKEESNNSLSPNINPVDPLMTPDPKTGQAVSQ